MVDSLSSLENLKILHKEGIVLITGKQEIYFNPAVIRMFTEASLDEGVTSRIFLKAGVIDVTGNYSYMYLPSEGKCK